VPGTAALTMTGGSGGGGPGNPQDLNRFSYVLNNPIKSVDPTGHCGGSVVDNFRSVFDGSCLSKAVAIWETPNKSWQDNVLASTYIGGTAIAAVYGSVGASAALSSATAAGVANLLVSTGITGEGAIVAGTATGGAVAGATSSAVSQQISTGSIDPKTVGVSAVMGALSGGLAPSIGSTNAGATILGAVTSTLQYGFTTDNPTPWGFAASAATGAAAGRVSGAFTRSSGGYDERFVDYDLMRVSPTIYKNFGKGAAIRAVSVSTVSNIDPTRIGPK
jgi:hypothetical protein